MIEIKKTGICEECTKADLRLDDWRDSAFDDHDWRLRCTHKEVCERLENMFAKKKDEVSK